LAWSCLGAAQWTSIAAWAKGGTKPQASKGNNFFAAGVALITNKPADGVESIDTAEGTAFCWVDLSTSLGKY